MLPFKESVIRRSTLFEFDLAVLSRTFQQKTFKLFAFRPRGVLDVETIVVRQAAPWISAASSGFIPRYDEAVPDPLPRLRSDLDFMPSPVEDRPGLLIRDSFRYSDAVLIIPPPLVECLTCFDGEQTQLELRQMLVGITGDLQVGEIEDQLIGILSQSGFLEDGNFARMKEQSHKQFAEAPSREPSHAGSAYPAKREELEITMSEWMGAAERLSSGSDGLIGIAAPHVSPAGGYASYRSAYSLLGPQYADRTFIILGTSHYGMPDRFGLTRKPYVTPYGETRTEGALIDELIKKAGSAIAMEDYCHAVEHSIEFQVLFLQSIFGADIRILPILVGSYGRSFYRGGEPERDDGVNRFLGALGEIAAREEKRLFWILGIDMAHMGKRYGDEYAAFADRDEMLSVAARDRQRMERAAAGDARGFWDLVRENNDDLKWCGSSPLYTFLKVRPNSRGSIEKYEQWNIDPQSVVSFAGMSFR